MTALPSDLMTKPAQRRLNVLFVPAWYPNDAS